MNDSKKHCDYEHTGTVKVTYTLMSNLITSLHCTDRRS